MKKTIEAISSETESHFKGDVSKSPIAKIKRLAGWRAQTFLNKHPVNLPNNCIIFIVAKVVA